MELLWYSFYQLFLTTFHRISSVGILAVNVKNSTGTSLSGVHAHIQKNFSKGGGP